MLPAMSTGLGVRVRGRSDGHRLRARVIVGAIPPSVTTMGWPSPPPPHGGARCLRDRACRAVSPSYALTLVGSAAGVLGGSLWGISPGSPAGWRGGTAGPAVSDRARGYPDPVRDRHAGRDPAGLIGWRFTFVAMAVFTDGHLVWVRRSSPTVGRAAGVSRPRPTGVFAMPGLAVLVTAVLYVTAHNLLYTYIAPLLAPFGLSGAVSTVLLVFGVASLVSLIITGPAAVTPSCPQLADLSLLIYPCLLP